MKDYIREGPGPGLSTADFVLGCLLYWRVWAMGGIMTVGYFGGAAIATTAGTDWFYPIGFVAGAITFEVAGRLSNFGDQK
ncbi:hypothetical protein [Natronorubrum sp. FCH18a]|uniref:hypothetical protein n=1 Tax=Natronorubrum sp. FCH18a TaxID=3447018 RepID=UPI003F514FF8